MINNTGLKRSFLQILQIIILGVGSTLSSQSLISYRGLALGSIIDDDLDLIYDPVDLQFVEGLRLYTNLSNATSSEEKVFGNQSDDEFLFGISAEGPLLKFLHHSLLIKFQSSETSNPIQIDSDLNGYDDLFGEGTISSEYNAFFGSDTNGNFDSKQTIDQKKSNLINNNDYSFILNNSIELWILSLGLKLTLGEFEYSSNASSVPLGSQNYILLGVNPFDPTFEKVFKSFLLNPLTTDFILSEYGDFYSNTKASLNRFDISAMFELGDFEIRGDASLGIDQNVIEVNDQYNGVYEYFDLDESLEESYSEQESYLSLIEEIGSSFGYGGSLRYTFDYQDERKNDGYWKLGVSMELGSYDYDASVISNYISNEFSFNGFNYYDGNIDLGTNNSTSTSDIGTKSVTQYAVNSKLNLPIGNSIHFGIGANLNHNKMSRQTVYNEVISNSIQSIFTDTSINNYTITETYQLLADRQNDITSTIFSLPTGLEYRLGQSNQFAFRFGSIFQLYSQTIDDTKDVTDSDPYTWIKKYSDGEQETNVYDNYFESTEENIKATVSTTVFTYGLGYNPLSNLQIDLVGMFNSNASFLETEFYRNLQISFTLKFD